MSCQQIENSDLGSCLRDVLGRQKKHRQKGQTCQTVHCTNTVRHLRHRQKGGSTVRRGADTVRKGQAPSSAPSLHTLFLMYPVTSRALVGWWLWWFLVYSLQDFW